MEFVKINELLEREACRKEPVAAALGISIPTLNAKISGRSEFTLKEIKLFQKCFRLTQDEIFDIFFSQSDE